MAFGERVGSAYVKLYADGDSVPDDIQKALDKLDPLMEDAGERHAHAYSKGFDKQSEKDSEETRDKLYKNLQKGLGRMHAIGETLGSDFFDGLQLQLTKELGDSDLGKLIRDKLEDDFAMTGSFDNLNRSLKDINRTAVESQMELDDMNDSAERLAKTLDEKLEKELRDVTKETDDMVRNTRVVMEDYNRSILRGNDALRTSLVDQGKEWVDIDTKMRAHIESTKDLDTTYKRFNKTLDDHAAKTARIFGKGARNDFVNLIGVMVGGITSLIFLGPKLASSLIGAFKGEGNLDITKIMSGLVTGITGIVIGITALILVAGPVAALISGITAAVVALVASLTFAAGAVGGVVFGLGTLLVPTIGIAILAIKNLDQETKDMAASVGKEFGKLGDVAGDAIGPGLREALKLVQPEIAKLSPLVDAVATSLGNVAVGFAEITKGQPYQNFVGALTQFLPTAIESLGKSFGNITEGFMGMFTAVRPLMTRFLNWFEDVTDRFAEWANSPKGQTELMNFFEAAGDSAAVIGDTLADITKAIGKLISAGKDTGDSLFKELGDQAEKLGDYLEAHPEAVTEWFGNGKQVAEDIGNLILDIVELIDDFDTAQAREELQDLFEAVDDVLELVGDLVDVWQFLWNNRQIKLDVLFSDDASIQDRIASIVPSVRISQAIGKAIVDGFESVPFGSIADGIVGWFTGLGDRITDAIDSVDWDAIIVNPVNRVHGWFGGLGDRITDNIGDIEWMDIISNPVQRVLGWFSSLHSRIENHIGNLDWMEVIANPIARLLGWFAGLAGRIANHMGNVDWMEVIPNPIERVLGWFAGLAGRMANQIGHLNWNDIINNPVDTILGWFRGLGGRITNAIGNVSINIDIPDPTPGYDIPGVPWAAAGRIVRRPTILGVGEAGDEAVVPLNRPLHMVDPSVRELSAIAQGLASPTSRGVVVEKGAIVVYEVADGRATAASVMNQMVARMG